jgi:hypothetical protein
MRTAAEEPQQNTYQRRYDVNWWSQMQGGKNGILAKEKKQTGSSETLIG